MVQCSPLLSSWQGPHAAYNHFCHLSFRAYLCADGSIEQSALAGVQTLHGVEGLEIVWAFRPRRVNREATIVLDLTVQQRADAMQPVLQGSMLRMWRLWLLVLLWQHCCGTQHGGQAA
jgi:hypothetical protein